MALDCHGILQPLEGPKPCGSNVTADSVSFIFCDHSRRRYVQLLVGNSPNHVLIRSLSLRNWCIEYCFLLWPCASYRVETQSARTSRPGISLIGKLGIGPTCAADVHRLL